MSIHYNAFISYKHAELDNRVAEDIQRCLERFPVPHAIKKKTGKKKIERIFRDKDELPITSDLTSNISEALENSDYLIVICSPNTAKSTWVKREIAYFLKNHTMNQVLTVLAGGESQDVIPDVLRHKEETITDENGEEHTITVPVEPLACDYRIPFGRAHKEEIPRLAAVLLGCSYDELVRRQRQYKMRQLGIIFSTAMALVLAFSGYMFYSKTQIDKNYQQALINQSRFLANESIRLYDNNQRVDALHLALASLPKSGNDKQPVIAESIKALITATGAYRNDYSEVAVDWNYEMDHEIKDYDVSPDGNYLATRDISNKVCIWNTNNHLKTTELTFNNIVAMKVIKDNSLIVLETDIGSNQDKIKTAHSFALTDGHENWSYSFYTDVNETNYESIIECTDNTFFITQNEYTLTWFNDADGKILKILNMPKEYEYNLIYDYEYYTVSPNGSKLAAKSIRGYILVYNLKTDEYVLTKQADVYKSALAWGDNDHVLFGYSKSTTGPYSTVFNNVNVDVDETHYYQCYNASDLSIQWEKSIQVRGRTSSIGFLNIPESKVKLFYTADSAYVFNMENGNTINGGHAVGSIIYASYNSSKKSPYIYTSAGAYIMLSTKYSDSGFVYKLLFPNNTKKVIENNGMYVYTGALGTSKSICHYVFNLIDQDIKTFKHESFESCYEYNDVLFCLTSDKEKHMYLELFDVNTTNRIDKIDLPIKEEYYYHHIFWAKNEKVYFGYYNAEEYYIASIDIKSKEITNTSVDYLNSNFKEIDGKLVCCYSDILYIYDLENAKNDSIQLGYKTSYAEKYTYLPNSKLLFLANSENYALIDIESKTIKTSDNTLINTYIPSICENKDGSEFVLSRNNYLYFLDKDLHENRKLKLEGIMPVAITLEKINGERTDTLFVADKSGYLYRYDPSSLILLGTSEFGDNSNVSSNMTLIFDHKRDLLYLKENESLTIIETKTWIQYVSINKCFGYSDKSDRFYVLVSNRIGWLKIYSLVDLKTKALLLLNGQEMSKEKKLQYGISD